MLSSHLGRWRNGRRSGLKIRFGETQVRVRVPPALPENTLEIGLEQVPQFQNCYVNLMCRNALTAVLTAIEEKRS
jgi:hypothetical protein